jgi:carbon-monoxide dehydrogenase small subunit
VLVNGKAVLSCLLLAPSVQGCTVTTIEGLSPKPDESQQERLYSPEQKAFADENAFQCGYCAPGLIMSTHELLSRYEELNAEEIRFHLSGNLCRCTGYEQQIQAVQNLFQKKKRGELG